MARKKRVDYFDLLESASQNINKAANYLRNLIDQYDLEKMPQFLEEFHEIEHAADAEHHQLRRHLAVEFITPIEREDIVLLARMIDTVVDKLEDVAINMYMHNLVDLRPEAKAFADICIEQSNEIMNIMREFKHFRKSTDIHEAVIRVNHLEEEGDELYRNAVHRLYREETDAKTLISWTKIYQLLEACCDACEDVSDAVENVVMKNS